ncbi:gastrin/cholecystokinin type B receptor [Esox lucius]|uniref:gastrin/cholecystokinin type B receptor n=1 Tax=Esox lucius TaxID=8010 RepID=UPI00097338AA|nr:gastrin/cholecystokinin type B receptor [Esox lucius]
MNLTNFNFNFGNLFFTNFSLSVPEHDYNNRSLQDTNSYPDLFLFSGNEPSTIVLVVMYTLSFLIGLVGNIMALLVLTRKRTGLAGISATRRLLVNLAVCDMMVVCVCMPVNLGHQVYNAWVFGDFLCRTVPFVQAVSVSASVLSLAVISLNRYYSVHNPLHARSFFTGRRTLCMICVVWSMSSGLAIPLLFMNTTQTLTLLDVTVTVCVESWNEIKLKQRYSFLLFCSLYGFPVLFNLIISVLTGWKLWGTDDKRTQDSNTFGVKLSLSRLKVRKRIAKMVLSLVVLFTLSWLPLYVVDIWLDFNMTLSLEKEEVDVNHVNHEWILQGRPFALWLGLTNSALNPLCYCFVGNLHRSAKRFRKSYQQKLSSVFSVQNPRQSSMPMGNTSMPKLLPYNRSQSEKHCAEVRSLKSVNLGEKVTNTKSLSSVTVCETVFD